MGKRLMEASCWERLTEGEIGSCSDVRGHVQYIFNPVFCWCVGLCSLPVIYLEINYGGCSEDNGDLLQNVPCMHRSSQCPNLAAGHLLPTPPPETPGHSWAGLGQSLVGSLLLLGPGVHNVLFVPSRSVFPPVLCKFWRFYAAVNVDLLQEGLCHTQVHLILCCPLLLPPSIVSSMRVF